MQISRTGSPRTGPRPSRDAAHGFTLIEVLCVLSIMACTVGLVGVSLQSVAERSHMDVAASHVMGLLDAAQEKACLTNRPRVLTELELSRDASSSGVKMSVTPETILVSPDRGRFSVHLAMAVGRRTQEITIAYDGHGMQVSRQ